MIHFKLCVRVILNRFSFSRGDVDCDSQRVISLSLLSIVDVALQDLVGPQSTWVDHILQSCTSILGFVSFGCAKLCYLIVYFDFLMVMP